MTIISFPAESEPWMRPQSDFEREAVELVSDSPYGADLVERLRDCASPFIRAAIIYCACGADDVPFLRRIAELRSRQPSDAKE